MLSSGSAGFTAGARSAGTFFNSWSTSWDGAGCGAGAFIGGVSGCAQPNFLDFSPKADLGFLGTGSTEFFFAYEGVVTASFLQGITAHMGDEFGWYGEDGQYHPLLYSYNTRGTTVTFDPRGTYALYFLDPVTGLRWRSDQLADAQSHFALFQNGSGYVVGMEDLPGSHTDFDYNDSIVSLQATPVPEPGSMLMIATGLGFVGMLRRKWRQ
jgi:hypothetical protein